MVQASVAACSFSPGLAGPGDGARPQDTPADTGSGSGSAAPDDRDGDGIDDAHDNCPDVANHDQANEDGDPRGDACDLCPAIKDDSNRDDDGDGIGNDCDPQPAIKDTLIGFTGFSDPAQLAEFATRDFGTLADWSIAGGQLHLTGATTARPYQLVWKNHDVPGDVFVATNAHVDGLDAGTSVRILAVTGSYYEPPSGTPDNYACGMRADDAGDNVLVSAWHFTDPANDNSTHTSGGQVAQNIDAKPAAPLALLARKVPDQNASTLDCKAAAQIHSLSVSTYVPGGGLPGVRAEGVTASYDWLFVVALGTAQ